MSVCLSVDEDISGTTRAIFTIFLYILPMYVARSSSGMLMIGRIACRREGDDGSAQSGRSVIYDRLPCFGRPARADIIFSSCGFLWPPYEIGGPLYFCPVVTIFLSFYLSIVFFLACSGRRLDVYHTSTHGVALVRI